MTKYKCIFLLIMCITIASCVGGPEPGEPIPLAIVQDEAISEEAALAEAVQEEIAAAEEFPEPEIETEPEPAEVITSSGLPSDSPFDISIAEPELFLPDIAVPVQQTRETPVLPEPPAPPPAQARETPPPAPPPPPPVPAPQPPAPPPPPPVTQNQPRPPAPPITTRPEPIPVEKELVFSRIIRATAGQILEIPFRGTGWVYLGELSAQRGINYSSRRLDPEGQSFIFQLEAAGTYILKFYKQDFIRDYIINDHVQVVVGQARESSGSGWFTPDIDRSRIIAEPRWPTSLEEAEIARSATSVIAPRNVTPAAAQQESAAPVERITPAATVTPAAPSAAAEPETAAQQQPSQAEQSPQGIAQASPQANETIAPTQHPSEKPGEPPIEFDSHATPNTFLQKAREEFEAGKVASALSVLSQFSGRYPAGSDEAYWLYGQFYEANSPSRDILTALDYYRRLVNEYPQSSRYNEARARIAYLERFYINIR